MSSATLQLQQCCGERPCLDESVPFPLLLGSSSQGLGASNEVTHALPGAGLGHLDRTPVVGQLSTYIRKLE